MAEIKKWINKSQKLVLHFHKKEHNRLYFQGATFEVIPEKQDVEKSTWLAVGVVTVLWIIKKGGSYKIVIIFRLICLSSLSLLKFACIHKLKMFKSWWPEKILVNWGEKIGFVFRDYAEVFMLRIWQRIRNFFGENHNRYYLKYLLFIFMDGWLKKFLHFNKVRQLVIRIFR